MSVFFFFLFDGFWSGLVGFVLIWWFNVRICGLLVVLCSDLWFNALIFRQWLVVVGSF